MWRVYYSPTSVDDALRLLAEHGPDARIIAGGTDLIVELQRGTREVEVLIDVTRIGGLNQVSLDDGFVHVGPTVTHNQAVASRLLSERGFPLALACWRVGTPQLRNRGTVAGNLITASPANDTIAALWALDARLTLRSVDGERTLAFADFYQGVRETALKPDEMVSDIVFPGLAPNQRGTFAKLALRRVHAVSVVNAAAVLTFDEDVVTQARIAMGSVAPTVVRAREAESALVGRQLDEHSIEKAAELAAKATSCIDDLRAGADYRRGVIRVLVRRALSSLGESDEHNPFPDPAPMLWGATRGSYPRLAGKTICHQCEGLEPIECTVNGENVVVQGANNKTLLDMLREDVGLTGTKEGCGEGECGACTVWMDGIAVLACLTPAPRAHGTQIVTIEGLAEGDELHPVQHAFIDEGAVQCGYCTPGFVMAGASLLKEIPTPTREQIEVGLSGNLCRCTGYYKIVRAIERAARGNGQ
ncbi:MAG: FAD binding domain-containing protein [Chloroflexota bacterium]|nr:FAD binding domain-containing protein [Chloroflexota bacterium]